MTREIISYKEAKELGLKSYFTGEPCLYRQVAERLVSTRHCQCFICVAKQKHKEKEYRENNPDRGRESYNRSAKRKRIEKCNPTFIKVNK